MPHHALAGKVRDLTEEAVKTRDFNVAMKLVNAIIEHATAKQEEMAQECLFLDGFLVELMRHRGLTNLTMTEDERIQRSTQMHCHFEFNGTTKTGSVRTCTDPTFGKVMDDLMAATKSGDVNAISKLFGKLVVTKEGDNN